MEVVGGEAPPRGSKVALARTQGTLLAHCTLGIIPQLLGSFSGTEQICTAVCICSTEAHVLASLANSDRIEIAQLLFT